jgi:hypothetical protein
MGDRDEEESESEEEDDVEAFFSDSSSMGPRADSQSSRRVKVHVEGTDKVPE